MSFLDTLLINGHDVRALAGVKIVGEIDLWAPGDFRGDDDEIANRNGAIGAVLPWAKYVIRVPLQVVGATRGERNDNLRALGPALRGSTGLVSLTRHVATGSGDDFDSHTAKGRYISGLAMTRLNHLTGRVELQYYNVSAAWWDGSTWLVP